MEKEWRCSSCGNLIGIIKDHRVSIRFKKIQYIVTLIKGSILNVCRNCSTINELDLEAAKQTG